MSELSAPVPEDRPADDLPPLVWTLEIVPPQPHWLPGVTHYRLVLLGAPRSWAVEAPHVFAWGPVDPLPASPGELLAACERLRREICACIRGGLPAVHADAGSIRLAVDGGKGGYLLPELQPLWDAMAATGLGDVPPFPGEPLAGHEALAALETVATWCRTKLDPTPTAPDKKGLKVPSMLARLAHRFHLLDPGKTQAGIAKKVSEALGYPVHQYQVSRGIEAVKKYLAAGNVLPDLDGPSGQRPKTTTMDPAGIDRGDGREGQLKLPKRGRRSRGRRDE